MSVKNEMPTAKIGLQKSVCIRNTDFCYKCENLFNTFLAKSTIV
jgi:hypothetical protein